MLVNTLKNAVFLYSRKIVIAFPLTLFIKAFYRLSCLFMHCRSRWMTNHDSECLFVVIVVCFCGTAYFVWFPLGNLATVGWCSEVEVSPVPASSGDSSRFGVCQILQVNERQMCGDSTTLIRPNQCHTVTTGQLEASLVTQCLIHSAKTSSDSPRLHFKPLTVLASLFCQKHNLLG